MISGPPINEEPPTVTMLSVGFSPCPNDTFMFHGLISGEIEVPNLVFRAVLDDIEGLNQRALAPEDRLPITKLSVAAFAQATDRYQALRSGAALGRGCGPLVVRRGSRGAEDDLASLSGKRVAIPREQTTANLLLRSFAPDDIEVGVLRFDQIMASVAMGEYDAGLIIHESRFTYPSFGLVEVADLGRVWERETGLPLPLGLIAIDRREARHAKAVSEGLARSIRWARADPGRPASYVRAHAQEMAEDVCRRHIELYVNDYSEDLGEEGRAAITEMVVRGRAAGADAHNASVSWSEKKSAILVPFDFSPPSKAALQAAKDLVAEPGGLHVLHVVVPVVVAEPYWNGPDMNEIAKTSEKALADAMKSEGIEGAKVVVQIGQAADRVVDYAEENGIELIVIPTHGRTGFNRFLMGSVAERVVRLSPCPVLVLRVGEKDS